MSYSKYGNKKVTCLHGHTHDSKKEARRCNELHLLEKAGEITELKLQQKYILIPTQREFTNEIYTKGKNKGCFKKGKIIEKECAYYADFDYIANGKHIVEDTKGMRTEVYKIKRKLMLKVYGVRITEI